MNTEDLIASAEKLEAPTTEVATEFEKKRDHLAAELNRRLLERPDLAKLIGGDDNRAMMEDNSRNFCRFMSSLFQAYDPATFVRTVLWVFRAYRTHGFQLTFWPAELDIFVDVMREELSPRTRDALFPFYNWLIVNIPAFVENSDEAIADFVPPEHG